ncbi:MAG: hypothetical protein E7160_00580 [Firmicutes bacterium]|nr:hypothetical protein [Bacillota bacterium]
MAWTKEQQSAIDLEGKNIIVSAGAGSGKTAVLTERVKRKLSSGIHINELLVLTFTNAAAAEMKERIRKAITKTEELKDELDLIDGAYITTFDSFSLSIVKKYHTKLNITNNIKITDEVVIDLEKRRILDEIFDEYYLTPNSNFSKLINDFCLKDDKELKEYILSSFKKIELKYDKEKYLNNYISKYFNEENINKYINEYLDLIYKNINNMKDLIIELNDYFDGDFVAKIEDNFKKLLTATNYNEIKNSLEYKTIQSPRNSDETGKKIKSTIFNLAKEIRDDLAIYNDIDEMKEEILSTKNHQEIIIDIMLKLNKKLEEYKNENNIYSFTDIAHLAIKVVEDNPEICEELTNSFNEILVDEYQDTSDTQEKFITMISNNNLYMVGDIKQSIYRFRNANPYIFKNKYDLYRDTDAGIKIDLLKNFRSREEVLSNINLLFDLFMDDEIGGADYKATHRMVFGNTSYIEEGKTEQNYDIDVLTYNSDDLKKITKDEQEAFIIANDIKEKIENKFQVFDKDTKILRDIKYSDFVILLDKSKNFDLYKKIFEYMQIPLSILKDTSLGKDKDILVIKSLLKLIISIKNKDFDKYSFISVGRSYLYKMTDEEIYEYFINNNYEESDLYKKCLSLIDNIDIESPSNYLKYILDEFNYEEKLLSIGKIKEYRVRCEYLYNLVSDYESSGNNIYDFIDYLDKIFEHDYDLKFNINEDISNSCKIMTIHKSKGLEFPICYFAGFSSKFNISELREKIIYDNTYGLVLPKIDEYYKDTVIKTLLKVNTKKEEISERIRLLYVALTRAKEKMIIVLPEQEEDEEVLDLVPTYERSKYNSFLSIMKSIYTTLIPYIKKTNIEATRDYLKIIKKAENSIKNDNDDLIVNGVSINTYQKEESHYSKDSLHIITKEEKEKLDFGTKVHEVLELLDFKNPDYSLYDITDTMKDKIELFLNTELIKENINNNMYKEYEFTYLEDNNYSHGIIDLMIDDNEKIIIVDYKLKSIDDPLYDNQLNGYRKVISNKLNKKVECYLYSIIDNKFRRVESE